MRKKGLIKMKKEIELVEKSFIKEDLPNFKEGDTVAVHVNVEEAGKVRTQVFEGVVIKRKGSGINSNFTVRKISYGVGVERVFPVNSPNLKKIEVIKKGKTKRGKLYYLRNKIGKKAKIEEER